MCSSGLLLLVVALLNFSVFTEQLQYVNDDPIEVSQLGESAQPTSGIESCMTSSESGGFNTRVYAIKTSGGSEFFRQSVNEDDEICFKNSDNIVIETATDFSNCARSTANMRYNSFTFNAGVCTAYKAWRPKSASTCDHGATVVPYYVVDEQLSDFTREVDRTSIVTFTNRDDTRVDIEIGVYDPCGQEDQIAQYELEFRGSVVKRLAYRANEMMTFTLNHNGLCDDDASVVIRHIGLDGERLEGTFVHYIPNDGVSRRYLETGNCAIINEDGGDYDTSKAFCESLGLTMFTEYVDGEFVAYAAAMNKVLATPDDVHDEDHFVYLKKEGGSWVWKGSELAQPDQATDPDAWASDSGNNDCVRSDEDDAFTLTTKNCAGVMPLIVCHKILT